MIPPPFVLLTSPYDQQPCHSANRFQRGGRTCTGNWIGVQEEILCLLGNLRWSTASGQTAREFQKNSRAEASRRCTISHQGRLRGVQSTRALARSVVTTHEIRRLAISD